MNSNSKKIIFFILLIIFIIEMILILNRHSNIFSNKENFTAVNIEKENYNNQNNVFIYWVGNEYKLIKILRQLMYYHSFNNNNYKIHFINENNIREYIDYIPEIFHKLQPAHQADFVRVNVICKYGGIWLDSDTIVMNDLSSLFNIINKKDGFLIKEYNSILNGVFGSKKETPFMKYWNNKVNDILKNKKTPELRWTELGSEILIDIRDNQPHLIENYKIFSGKNEMYPFEWDSSVIEYIDKPYNNYRNIERDYQPLIILVNSVYKGVEDKTLKEIIKGNDMPISYFIKKSLKNSGYSSNNLLKDLITF